MKAAPNSARFEHEAAERGPSWVGAVLRSTVPRGRILGIDYDPAFPWDRVVRVTAADIFGRPSILPEDESQPVLASREVQYVGQPVLLLAAPDGDLLEAALKAVEVRYQPWMPVLDLEESIEAKLRIRGTGNVIRSDSMGVEREIGRDAKVVESDFTFASNEEPISCRRGASATPLPDGGVRISLSILEAEFVRGSVAAVLGLSEERIEIEAIAAGVYEQCIERECLLASHAAALALAAGREVRLVPRHFMGVAARHSGQVTIKSLLTEAGDVTDTNIDVTLDGGAYSARSDAVLDRIFDRVISSYDLGHLVVNVRVMATNTPPKSIIGNSGAAQLAAAIERHVDRVANEVGVDAIAYRRQRLVSKGDSAAVVDYAVEHSSFRSRTTEMVERPGVRVAVGLAAGFGGSKAGRSPVSAARVSACDVVEIELDLVTFETRVLSVEAFRAGRGLRHADVKSGIERAAARVLGHGAKPVDAMCPPGLSVLPYRGMPTTAPAPRITVREVPLTQSGGDEAATVSSIDAVEPAILSAVEQALGVPLDFLPLTPEALATAWATHRDGDGA